MKGPATGAIRDRWERSPAFRAMLAPAAQVYRGGIALRRWAFRTGLRRAVRAEIPVVSVGNLTVGGTGKTPAALWVAGVLREAGCRPVIVTRGYGGSLEGRVHTVGEGGKALLGVREIGDEAVLLSERFDGPVVCGADRVAAVRHAVREHAADVAILDDAFQHWPLMRDFDLVLVDGTLGFGNEALLPAGPLREPLSALGRASAILVTKGEPSPLLREAFEHHAPGVPVYRADLEPRELIRAVDGVLSPGSLGGIVGRQVVTVCGLARPESFYDVLGQLETRAVEVLEFPDHHDYTHDDWQRITKAAHRAELVVCTEKDIVKLRRFPFAKGRLVAVRVAFAVAEDDENPLLSQILGACGLRRVGARATPAGSERP